MEPFSLHTMFTVLIHLHEDVEHFGTNLDVSCFPFENYLQKSLVRNSQNPLAQIVKCSFENETIGISNGTSKTVLTRVSVLEKDSSFVLNNGDFACVKSHQNNHFECDVLKADKGEGFFRKPCDSYNVSKSPFEIQTQSHSFRVINLIEKLPVYHVTMTWC